MDRRNKRWGYNLRSHHGPYCALCLKTIWPEQDAHLHHVLPREAFSFLFPELMNHPWTVPGHAKCHLPELQGYGNGLTSLLWRLLHTQPKDQDRICAAAHELGYYWIPVCINGYRLRTNKRVEIDTLNNFLKSSAGIIQGKRVLNKILPDSLLPRRLDVIVSASNLEFSSGSDQEARHLFALAERLSGSQEIPRAKREEWRGALMRREAQLDVDTCAAKDARSLVSPDSYSWATATLQLAWIEYVRGNLRRASNFFELVMSGKRMTWLYRAEVLFGRALCSMKLRKIDEEVYSWLVTAQYLYAILGMIGPSARFLWYLRSTPGTPIYPTDVLISVSRFHSYSDKQCQTMREAAIAGQERAHRLIEIISRQNLVYGVFDLLMMHLGLLWDNPPFQPPRK